MGDNTVSMIKSSPNKTKKVDTSMLNEGEQILESLDNTKPAMEKQTACFADMNKKPDENDGK